MDDLKTTINEWLETMKKVTNEHQEVDELSNEDCGLRNEMD